MTTAFKTFTYRDEAELQSLLDLFVAANPDLIYITLVYNGANGNVPGNQVSTLIYQIP